MNTQQDPHSRQSLVSTEWSISAMEVEGAVADSFPSSELYTSSTEQNESRRTDVETQSDEVGEGREEANPMGWPEHHQPRGDPVNQCATQANPDAAIVG